MDDGDDDTDDNHDDETDDDHDDDTDDDNDHKLSVAKCDSNIKQ